jgi:peptide/nickel transport system substrate-binding protein
MHQHNSIGERRSTRRSPRGVTRLAARLAGARPGSRLRPNSALALAGALAAVLTVAACAGSSSSNAGNGALPVVYESHVIATNLDPDIGVDGDSLLFIRNVYEGLLQYAPGSTTLQPALATSYTTSDGGLTYTFQLRKGVTFHDGTAFDSASVVTSLDRLKAINQGPASYLDGVRSWTAKGKYAVVFTLSAPNSYFAGDLPWLPILSPAGITAHKTTKDPWATSWFSNHEDGTGPYELTTFVANDHISLQEFDGYWQKWPDDVPTSATITQVVDPSTRIQLLKSGQATFSDGFAPADLTSLKNDPNVAIAESPGLSLRTIMLNTTAQGPMSDPRFRQALILAFPYQAYFSYYQGWGQAANGPIPPGMTGYDKSLPNFTQNLTRAKQLLQAGGWLNSGVKLTYVSVQGESYGQYAGTLLQSALAQFGITVETEALPWPQIPPLMANPKSAFDLSFLNLSVNTNDPTSLIQSSYSSQNVAAKGGFNFANLADPKVDSLVTSVREAKSSSATASLTNDLTQQLLGTYSSIFAIAPINANPVGKAWADVKYDSLYNLNVLRFFYAHKGNG